MKWFILIVGLFVVLMLLFDVLTRKYINYYTLAMYFGKKGSGKSTNLTRIAQDHLRKGWIVYSNFPIKGCYLFDVNEFGFKRFPKHSLVIIDEVSLIWSNRDFKSNFGKENKCKEEYFRFQRKYCNKIILGSQSFDVDKKVRDLCDELYLVENFMRVFTSVKTIRKYVTIVTNPNTGDGNLSEGYKFNTTLFRLPKFKLYYNPKWFKYFDTLDGADLNKKIVKGKIIM